MSLTFVDWLIMLVYFVFVIGIGLMARRYTKTSEDFFQAGRSIPAWVAGLAFLSANLGAQEVIGMAASGAKYGIATAHFYWIGARAGDGIHRALGEAEASPLRTSVEAGLQTRLEMSTRTQYSTRPMDIRIPIGQMFVVLGVLIAGYGLVSDPRIYERSLGININLIWGVTLAVFGAGSYCWRVGVGLACDGDRHNARSGAVDLV